MLNFKCLMKYLWDLTRNPMSSKLNNYNSEERKEGKILVGKLLLIFLLKFEVSLEDFFEDFKVKLMKI